MKKRLLSLVLCLVMVFSLFPAFAVPASAVTGDEVADDDTYSRSGTVYTFQSASNTPAKGTVTFVVNDQVIESVTFTNSTSNPTWNNATTTGMNSAFAQVQSYLQGQLVGKSATANAVNNALPSSYNGSYPSDASNTVKTYIQRMYVAARDMILAEMGNAPAAETLGPGEEWIYTPVTTPAGGWKTDSTYPDQRLYAEVNGEYVPVTIHDGDIYEKLAKTSWTPQEAHDYVANNNRDLFYKNGSTFEKVYPSQDGWFENAGTVSVAGWNYKWWYSQGFESNYYYNSAADGAAPSWHRVYYAVHGRALSGWAYYFTFYIYTNSMYGNAVKTTTGATGSINGYDSTYTNAINNGTITLITDDEGAAHISDGDTFETPYTGGKLYTYHSSNDYTALWTSNDGGETSLTELAWALPASNGASTYQLHSYSGDLYAVKPGVTKITYGDGTILTQESNIAGNVLYNGTLYTRTKGTRGDLVGYKHLSDRNADGSYDLMIDSWATGPIQGYTTTEAVPGTQPTTTVTEKTVEKKVPLDVVLVIDQSGSMGTADMGETITGHPMVPHEGDTWKEREINNGTEYYCKIGENDYRRVYTQTGNVFTEADSKKGNKMFSFGHDGVSLMVNGSPVHFNVPTNYYVKYNGEMHKLYMITVGKDLEYGLYPYIYTDDNSTYAQKAEWSEGIYWVAIFRPWSAKLLKDDNTWSQAVSGIRWVNSNGETLDPTDSNGDSVKTQYRRLLGIGITDAYYIKNLYTVSNTATTALYYLDDSGNKVYISNTRTMGEDEFTLDTSKCDGNLYTAVSDSTRVQALRKAAETFTEALAQNAKDNNVNHRMAIVGFAGNMFPSYSTGETAVHNSTTTREYTDTGVFLNNGFVNYGTMNASNAYTKVEGVTSTSGLYVNKHYYIKDGDNYLPIAYDYSSSRWYYTDNGAWLTSRNGSYRGTFYEVNLDAITATQYKNALVNVYDANDGVKYNYNDKQIENIGNEVNDDLDHAIDNFGFYGGTYTSYGLAMANSILAQNPVGTGTQVTTTKVKVDGVYDETQTTTETEQGVPGQRIIVVFTDGEPGASGYNSNIANEALAGGVQAKMSAADNGYGAKVYTVGLYPNNVSSQVENFMHQLSSEYTANIRAVDAVSDYAASSALNGNSTYYYKEADGKYYAVTASINGQSTLGWWEHNVADNSYSQLNVEGEKGSGEHPIYSDRNHQNQVFGENANHNTTYYSYDGDPVRFEYRWYDADRHIREPILGGNASLPEGAYTHNRYQFYEITGQTANADGESYYTRVRTGLQLADAFTSIVNSIKITAETTVTAGTPETQATTQSVSYGAQNAMIRDVINAAFEIDPNAVIELQLIQSNGLSDTEITQDGKTFKLPNEGTQLGSGTGSMIYTYNSKTETIQAVQNGRTVDVTGFEFSDHYITASHDGAFLRVIVKGLQPNGVGTLYSNTNAAAISSKKADNTPGDTFFSYNNPSVTVQDYTVTWVNGEQTLEKDEHVPFNAVPSYESGDPMRAPSSVERDGKIYTTTYNFEGWSEDANADAADIVTLANEKITKDTTYYAIFSETNTETRNSFTVKWNNGDLLQQDNNVAAGTVPEYNSAEPVNGNMVFVGWTTNSFDTTLTNQRIDDGDFPANFAVQPNLPVEYYPADDNGVVNFYAVFMAKGQVIEANKKVVVEYSTKNLIDSDVYEFETSRASAGTFIKEKTADVEIGSKGTVEVGNLFFVPKMQQTDSFAYDLTPMSSVSTAKYYTGHSVQEWNLDKTLTTVTVVAGSSIYLDDSLTGKATGAANEETKTYDYTAALSGANVNSTAAAQQGTIKFKFTGTRIDVYCTTTANGKSVTATLMDADGVNVVKVNGKPLSVRMKNQSTEDRYNVPTISFDAPLTENGQVGTYTLVISDAYADFKLDGVRVYNSVAELAGTAEEDAHYIKLRDKLVENFQPQIDDYMAAMEQYKNGEIDTPPADLPHVALFTDKNNGTYEIDKYVQDGPKNEIYLSPGQSVAFEIKSFDTNVYDNAKVSVGLSVQGSAAGTAKLNSTSTDTPVSAVTDSYYPVTVARDGNSKGIVVITNSGQVRLAVTNLKITNVSGEPQVVQNASALSVAESETETFEPEVIVSSRLLKFMENPEFTEVQPTPSPDPTHQPTIQDWIRQMISDFVRNLFGSIGRLFGN